MLKKPYRLGAIAFVVNSSDEVLLVQLNSYGNQDWNMPGGGREGKEGATQNAIRELNEELGIQENELQLLGISSKLLQYDFPKEMLQNKELIALTYAGQKKDQVVFRTNLKRILDINRLEIHRYKWCSITKLNKYLNFPGQYNNAINVLKEFGLII